MGTRKVQVGQISDVDIRQLRIFQVVVENGGCASGKLCSLILNEVCVKGTPSCDPPFIVGIKVRQIHLLDQSGGQLVTQPRVLVGNGKQLLASQVECA